MYNSVKLFIYGTLDSLAPRSKSNLTVTLCNEVVLLCMTVILSYPPHR